jgi:hypothetical protein
MRCSNFKDPASHSARLFDRFPASVPFVVLMTGCFCLLAGCLNLRTEPLTDGGVTPDRQGSGGQSGVSGSGGSPANSDADVGGGIGGVGATGGGGGSNPAVINVDAAGSPGIDAPADSTTSTNTCVVGTLRCATGTAAVETCSSTGEWKLDRTCPSICLNGACAGMCTPNDRQCATDQKPQLCSMEGQWKDESPCIGQTCVKGVCQGACAPTDPKRCSADGVSTQTCGAGGTWMNVDACGNNGCTAGACNACRPSTKVCQGKTLRTCNDSGSGWLPDLECGISCDPTALKCINCQPRTETCNGQDDDCDGQIDDGTLCNRSNGTADCRSGRCANTGCNSSYRECSGNCVAASQYCGGGCGEGYEACNQKCYRLGSLPKESCDGVDNNCSGGVDEGNLCKSGESCAGSKGCKKANGVVCSSGSECAGGTCQPGTPPVGYCSKRIDQECWLTDAVPCKPEDGACINFGSCR